MLADLDTWHVRGDGAKLAAKLRRRIGLQIKGIELTWSAEEENDNARAGAAETERSRSRAGARQELRQQQPHGRQPTHLEHIPPRAAVTGTLRGADEAQHQPVLRPKKKVSGTFKHSKLQRLLTLESSRHFFWAMVYRCFYYVPFAGRRKRAAAPVNNRPPQPLRRPPG